MWRRTLSEAIGPSAQIVLDVVPSLERLIGKMPKPATLTAAQTIDRLRELEPDAETIYYVYVVDRDERLVGVLSLRDLIVAKPETLVSEVMIREPVAVGVLADKDEVAQVVARYNLLAVPVVDDEGRLEGIVTVDDTLDTVLPTSWKRRLPRPFSRSAR